MRPLHLLVLALLVPASAAAHGGIPISQQILVRGDTLYVPTKFWGVFYGKDTPAAPSPWRWICEEAINKFQARKWALALDGALHVTDYFGITSSTDGGCTWVSSTGEIALRSTSAILADPVEPKRAWATTDSGPSLPWNALFSTSDSGATWTPVLQGDEYFRGVTLSADGQRVYVVGSPRMGDGPPHLHVSKDRGKSWSDVVIGYQQCVGADSDGGAGADMQTCFSPLRLVPLEIDPADAETLYLRIESDPVTILLRATSDGKAVELLRAAGTVAQPGIGDLAWSADGKTLFVPTRDGMMAQAAGGAFAKVSSLSQAQCVERRGDALYACTWNYSPDFAAISRSDDNGAHFSKVFKYDETVGPIDSCAPSTPVGKICPEVWAQYAAQLGATLGGGPSDGGGGDGGGAGPAPGCSCALGGRARAGGCGLGAAVLLGLALVRRRRPSRAPRSAR